MREEPGDHIKYMSSIILSRQQGKKFNKENRFRYLLETTICFDRNVLLKMGVIIIVISLLNDFKLGG